MKYLIPIFLFLGIFSNCGNPENMPANKAINQPIDWEITLQKATSFKEETELLETLIHQDSSNTYQQLIANRLQTFDLRHLKENEKLTILDLYELSLQPTKKPSNTILQIAYAKLNAVYPTNTTLADEKITKLIHLIKENGGADLEF